MLDIIAVPGVIPTDDITQPERTVTTVVVQWKEPDDYNAPITMYELDLCQKLLQDSCPSVKGYPLDIIADEYTNVISIVRYRLTPIHSRCSNMQSLTQI